MEKELRVRFTGDAQDLRRAAQDAERAMREVERTQSQAGLSAAELGKKLGGLAAAYLSLQAASMAAQKGLQGLASIEQSELTFEVLFGSADKAKRKMEELVQFAAKTPFELPGIVDAAKALETFGLNSTKYLKDAGDLAAAFNVDISEVARAFGRIDSGDFGEAFERMRDFGISRQMLEGEGLVFDKSGSYQGSVDQALTAVQAIIQRKFGGMMERQADTFSGQMSTLSDNVQTALNTVMEPAFNSLNETVKQLNTSLDGAFGEEMQANARVLGDVIGGVTTAALALGKATGDTLREIMAPLRWMKDTATALGKGAGERDVAKSLVMSSGINPNRAQHYANLVGRGEDLGNIANDFRVKSWGDPKGVQEDLGKIATAIAKARMIVDGTIQYTNYEPYGPQPGSAGKTTTTKASGTITKSTKTGKTPREIQESWVDGMVEESVDALELRLGGLLSGQSQGMTSATSRLASGLVRGQNYGMGLGFTSLDSRLNDAMQTPTGGLGLVDPGSEIAPKISGESERAMRSGLEAGVSAFLDGGIGNLGEATYSLSKDAFGKALVDGVMSGQLKDAFGGLGAMIAPVLANPIGLAVAGVLGFALQDTLRQGQEWGALRDRYADKKPEKSQIEKDRERVSAHMGGLSARLAEIDEKLSQPQFLSGIEQGNLNSERERILRQIADTEKLAADINKTAAEEQKKAAAEQLAAASERAAAARDVMNGTKLGLNLSNRDLEVQLQESLGLITSDQAGMMRAKNQGNDVIREAVNTVGAQYYGGGQSGDNMAWDTLNRVRGGASAADIGSYEVWGLLQAALRNANLIQQNAQAQYGANAGIGSMSNPDQALQFDAPTMRSLSVQQTIAVNTYAVTGDKASFRALVKEIMAEANTVMGQAV